ncbi:MAG: hypothetical protein HOM58_04015 [Rhodospirillaceae bacterium]|nr:hypothetical protein [Rhodospirillaceae bacterium]MBT5458399.1 hypothetical protein [Rhodospirillaceae bacterium]
MTKKPDQKEAGPMAKTMDRRRFLELSRKYAVIAPPAVTLMIAATDAEAHCSTQGNIPAPHSSPSCATNH